MDRSLVGREKNVEVAFNDTDYDDHPNELSGIDTIDINTNNPELCLPFIYGCTDNGLEISGSGVVNDFDEDELAAFNYNSEANTDDGNCYPIVDGCMDPNAFNFNDYDYDNISNDLTGIAGVDINTQSDSSNCFQEVYGCMDETAFNYNDYDYDGIANAVSYTHLTLPTKRIV